MTRSMFRDDSESRGEKDKQIECSENKFQCSGEKKENRNSYGDTELNNNGSSEGILTIEASDAILPSRKGLDKSALVSVILEDFVIAQKNCPTLK